MEFIGVDHMLYSEDEIPGSGKAAISVSAGPDNGFNNCAASKYAGALRHPSTQQAISNILPNIAVILSATAGKGPPHLAGHGDAGFMTFGCGQNGPQNYDNTIGTWNENSWGPHFDLLKAKQYAILTLISCTTGAADDGADLLYAIARRSGHPVRARTGLTYCGSGGITFEAGSTWQVATPTNRPTPIPPPSSHFVPSAVIVRSEGRQIDRDTVSLIVVDRRNHLLGTTARLRFDKVSAQAILNMIDFEHPFEPGGVPGGMVQVEMELHFESDTKPMKLAVYNFSVAQDMDAPNVFYRVHRALSSFLR